MSTIEFDQPSKSCPDRAYAEIAEAEAIGQAERVEAEMEEIAEVVRTEAETVVLQKDNDVRTQVAEMEKARSEEERIRS